METGPWLRASSDGLCEPGILSLNIVRNGMPLNATFHLGFHCLPKYRCLHISTMKLMCSLISASVVNSRKAQSYLV